MQFGAFAIATLGVKVDSQIIVVLVLSDFGAFVCGLVYRASVALLQQMDSAYYERERVVDRSV